MQNPCNPLLIVLSLLILLAPTSGTPGQKAQTRNSAPKNQSQPQVPVTGYLVDRMCAASMVKRDSAVAMAKAKKHTVACAFHEECASSGFGLIVNGRFIRFSPAGDTLALAYLNATNLTDNVFVDAFATSAKEPLEVTRIVPHAVQGHQK